MLWGENRGKWKRPTAARSQTQDTSGLSYQCSATELRQPDNHQPSKSSIRTAQVVLNASVTHLAATQHMRQNSVRCRLESSLYQERTMLSGFSHSKCTEHLTSCWKEMSFQQAICYLSLRWVNILYAWTVNSVNRLVKNPKHITAITFTPSLTFTHLQVVRNAYSSASRMPDYLLVIGMGEGYTWLKRWLLQCVLDSEIWNFRSEMPIAVAMSGSRGWKRNG